LKTDGLSIIVLPNAYFIKDIYRVWRTGSFPGFGQPLDRYNSLQTWVDLIEKNNLKVLKANKFNPKWPLQSLGHLAYRIARPFIPLNLSYAFVFTCKPIKQNSGCGQGTLLYNLRKNTKGICCALDLSSKVLRTTKHEVQDVNYMVGDGLRTRLGRTLLILSNALC
jgi:hypothetical protein